jgi:hypothetical protein
MKIVRTKDVPWGEGMQQGGGKGNRRGRAKHDIVGFGWSSPPFLL